MLSLSVIFEHGLRDCFVCQVQTALCNFAISDPYLSIGLNFQLALQTSIGGRPVRIGGIAKGSGMIHPNMATMLGVITTDAAVAPSLWRAILQHGVAKSFNQVKFDARICMLRLANGKSLPDWQSCSAGRILQLTMRFGYTSKVLHCIHYGRALAWNHVKGRVLRQAVPQSTLGALQIPRLRHMRSKM